MNKWHVTAQRGGDGLLCELTSIECSCVLQFKVCPKSQCVSTPGHRTDLFLRDPGSALITDFFGSVRKVEITREAINLTSAAEQPVEVT